MSFEYRIFFPLSDSPASDFSLFHASDFSAFEKGSAPSTPAAREIEHRTDHYLLDSEWGPAMQGSFGLKLRGKGDGAGVAFDKPDKVQSFQLELKVRTHPGLGEADAASAATDVGRSEEWKKVLKHCAISSSLSGLTRSILPALESCARDAKPKKQQLIATVLERVRAKREAEMAREREVALKSIEGGAGESGQPAAFVAPASSASSASSASAAPFHLVSVAKHRSSLPRWDAEQTDVDVTVQAAAGSKTAEPRVYRYRSICFEGDKAKVESEQIKGLWKHILKRYGDQAKAVSGSRSGAVAAAAAVEVAASPAAAAASSAASPSGPPARVTAYPEFLLGVLQNALSEAK